MTGVVSRTIYTRFYDARAQPRCGPLQTHLSTSGTFINRSSRIVLPSIPLAGTSLLFSIIFLANDIPPRPIFLENSDAKHCFDSYR